MSKFLGIDTSCYTTSAAIFDTASGIVAEERIILSVKEGHRGLSQSEMVFQHTKNLPVVLKKLGSCLQEIDGIGVSIFPRRRADSYMPVFFVGKGFAESIALSKGIPVFEFSHQENHALAAVRESPDLWNKPFYMIHLSGGTQDVLCIEWVHNEMNIKNLIHSNDITAGQFIDRIGVSLHLSFPAGPKMEELACCGEDSYHVPVAKTKNAFSYAGPETKVQKDILSGKYKKEDIAKGVLVSIGESLKQVLGQHSFQSKMPFIAVGGVMSNRYLRNIITGICNNKELTPVFANPKYSSDNATGNAFGAFMRYSHENLYGKRM